MESPHDNWQPQRTTRHSRFIMGVFVGVAATAGSMFLADRLVGQVDSVQVSPQSLQIPTPPPLRTEDSVSASRRTAIVEAVERVSPAVVTISVTQLRRERVVPFNDPMWQFFFPDMGREFVRRVNSMGSGFIISEDGLIITNEHVVRGASEIVVSLPDGRSFDGVIHGEPDPQTDLALIKIDGDSLPVAPLGRSEDLIIGEWAIAIGNPFGYLIRDAHPTVTVGVISALNRDFDASTSQDRVYRDMIQTDASINPGNSGGPLVNSEGYVVGVNTFIFSQSGGSQGVGFAIPIRKVRQIVDDILRYGEVRHNFWTGIHIQDVTRLIAETFGLPSDRGAIITEVEDGSPAVDAGLRRGDVIVGVSRKPVASARDVREAFLGLIVGETVDLTVIRAGSEQTVTLTLGELPSHRRKRG
jgi:serine protease Do